MTQLQTPRHVRIAHLYPDLMNLYGDRGNVIALRNRCIWRGFTVEVGSLSLGDTFRPEDWDIVFMGGGQDFEQGILQDDLAHGKADAIREAVLQDVVFLTICGGYQLLGKYYRTHDGKEIEGLGALDIWTHGGTKRMIGNLVFSCDFLSGQSGDDKVIGFENHSGRTYLGPDMLPLGRVLFGSGNNGEDGFEGVRHRNVIGSYSHGSLLPKNPRLADYLIEQALKRQDPDFSGLVPLDDKLELAAAQGQIQRFCK